MVKFFYNQQLQEQHIMQDKNNELSFSNACHVIYSLNDKEFPHIKIRVWHIFKQFNNFAVEPTRVNLLDLQKIIFSIAEEHNLISNKEF